MYFLSLFSGVGGLDMGFIDNGFEPILFIEMDSDCIDTLRNNVNPDKVWKSDVRTVKITNIPTPDVLIGGPPCQPFSVMGKRRGFSDPRSDGLTEYIRILNDTHPKIFVIEEVPHVLHKSYNALKRIDIVKEYGYHYRYKILNSADYGVPQKRRRVIFVGTTLKKKIIFPNPTHIENAFGTKKRLIKLKTIKKPAYKRPWVTIRDVCGDMIDMEHEFIDFSPNRLEYLRKIPPGGNWRDLPGEDIKKVMGPHPFASSRGGRTGFLRRLSWDKPSPTLMTSPTQQATTLCHPEKDRPLSIEEYKRIQQFPDTWKFFGTTQSKYRQIGNAVPVGLSNAIAKSIKKMLEE